VSTTTIPATRREQRQARIDAQRRKLAVHHRAARLKRLIAVGIIGLAVIGVVAGWLLLSGAFRDSLSAGSGTFPQARTVPDEGQQHVAAGTLVDYRSRPPASGPHYENEAPYAFFDQEVPTGNWIHNLEHGGVVVLYRPDLVSSSDLAALRTMRDNAPISRQWRTTKMVVLPYTDMDHAVAAVAWDHIDEMDSVDTDQILGFYRTFVDRGPEQAL
jgi:hypothetical protein